MTEPREPAFPQPEGTTPVVPSSPAGEWPQPPAAASFPPPPTPGGAFAGTVPPLPPLPGVPPVPPPLPPAAEPTWADPAGAAARPTWSDPVPEAPDEAVAPSWAEPSAAEQTPAVSAHSAEPSASEPGAPQTTEAAEPVPVAVWGTPSPVEPEPAAGAASEESPVAEALPVPDAVVAPDDQSVPATVETEPAPIASWGEPTASSAPSADAAPTWTQPVSQEAAPVPAWSAVPGDAESTAPSDLAEAAVAAPEAPAVPEAPVSATPVPEPIAAAEPEASAEAASVVDEPSVGVDDAQVDGAQALPVADEPEAPADVAAQAPSAALPSVPAWTQPEPVAPEPIAAQEPDEAAALLPPAPLPAAPMPAPPAPGDWGQPAADGFADDDAIFRPYPGAAVPAAEEQAVSEEERRLAAERAARRAASEAALTATVAAPGPIAAADAASTPIPEPVAPVTVVKRTTDGFWGSLGLFLVRLVMAGIFGIRGVQMLLDTAAAHKLFSSTVLPMPTTMALVTAVACVLIAVSMVLGLATRYSGLGAALIAGGSLGLVYWGPWSVFVPNQFGFLGEGELLMAVVGLLLLFIGGGGWSLDRGLRSARERDKAERTA